MKEGKISRRLVSSLCCLAAWLFQVGAWAFVWVEYYSDRASMRPGEVLQPFGWKGNLLVVAVYGVLLFFVTLLYGGYRIRDSRRGDLIFSSIFSSLLAGFLTYFQACLISRSMVDPWPMLVLAAVDCLMLWLWSTAAFRLYYKLYPPRRLLLIYGKRDSTHDLIHKLSGWTEKYHICESVEAAAWRQAMEERAPRYDGVLISDVESGLRNDILKYSYKHSIRAYLTPKISDILVRGALPIHLFDTPLLLSRNNGLTPEERAVKRAMDLVLSLLGLLIFSPFFLVVALAVKLYDGGPVLYRQTRLTLDGKTFSLYKFRSMVVDAEKEDGAVISEKGDSRITPVGRMIRRVRLDELPQIFNILKGDMSIVGPRPERPEIAVHYMETFEEFSYRLKVKAGLTGYAQVLGKYDTSPYDKLKLDLMYISSYSLLTDVKMILMTVKILISPSGLYGG